MVRLRLLGRVSLERDGQPVTGRAAQRHPLALLSLLATSPGGESSRDRLVGYLWPEAETRRARHRLSVALHVLRSALGGTCIVSRSDGLALDPLAVWTDVGAFHAAVAAGRLEEAASLYAGPFLDGFFLSGARDLEQWVERERGRLAALHEGAVERLAAEAESRGDTVASLHWCRRLEAADPLSATGVMALMRALRNAGDPQVAILQARAHAVRLSGELGLPPNPEVAALAAEIAAQVVEQAPLAVTPPPGEADAEAGGEEGAQGPAERGAEGGARALSGDGSGARGRSVALAALASVALLPALLVWSPDRGGDLTAGGDGPGSVAVLPLGLRGTHPEALRLAQSTADRVRADLAGVPGLSIAAAGVPPLHEGAAADRARAAGAELLLTVQARGVPGGGTLAARLVETSSGAQLWDGQYDVRGVGEDGRLVNEVAMEIADGVRLRVSPYEPKVYTENERAYERFLEGVYLQRKLTERDLWKALQLYREGYEEDADFALAHAISAHAYMALVGLGLDPETGFRNARKHARAALAIDSTLAEGQVAMAAIELYRDWDLQSSAERLRRAIMLYPTLPQARSSYGHLLLRAGVDPDAAITHLRRALELDPLNAARSFTIEQSLILLGRYTEALEQHEVTRALAPDRDFNGLGSTVGDAYRGLGRYEEALDVYRAAWERTGLGPAPGLLIAYVRMGRDVDAVALLPQLIDLAETERVSPEHMAAVLAALGDHDAAFGWLGRGLAARSSGLLALRVDPDLDPLRGDPRFDHIRRQIGLPR